jgi:hypothetical protein
MQRYPDVPLTPGREIPQAVDTVPQAEAGDSATIEAYESAGMAGSTEVSTLPEAAAGIPADTYGTDDEVADEHPDTSADPDEVPARVPVMKEKETLAGDTVLHTPPAPRPVAVVAGSLAVQARTDNGMAETNGVAAEDEDDVSPARSDAEPEALAVPDNGASSAIGNIHDDIPTGGQRDQSLESSTPATTSVNKTLAPADTATGSGGGEDIPRPPRGYDGEGSFDDGDEPRDDERGTHGQNMDSLARIVREEAEPEAEVIWRRESPVEINDSDTEEEQRAERILTLLEDLFGGRLTGPPAAQIAFAERTLSCISEANQRVLDQRYGIHQRPEDDAQMVAGWGGTRARLRARIARARNHFQEAGTLIAKGEFDAHAWLDIHDQAKSPYMLLEMIEEADEEISPTLTLVEARTLALEKLIAQTDFSNPGADGEITDQYGLNELVPDGVEKADTLYFKPKQAAMIIDLYGLADGKVKQAKDIYEKYGYANPTVVSAIVQTALGRLPYPKDDLELQSSEHVIEAITLAVRSLFPEETVASLLELKSAVLHGLVDQALSYMYVTDRLILEKRYGVHEPAQSLEAIGREYNLAPSNVKPRIAKAEEGFKEAVSFIRTSGNDIRAWMAMHPDRKSPYILLRLLNGRSKNTTTLPEARLLARDRMSARSDIISPELADLIAEYYGLDTGVGVPMVELYAKYGYPNRQFANYVVSTVLGLNTKPSAAKESAKPELIETPTPIPKRGETEFIDFIGEEKAVDFTTKPEEEQQAFIDRVLSYLTTPQRAAVSGRYGLDGDGSRTLRQLTEELGITQSVVERNLQQGRSVLREVVDAELGGGFDPRQWTIDHPYVRSTFNLLALMGGEITPTLTLEGVRIKAIEMLTEHPRLDREEVRAMIDLYGLNGKTPLTTEEVVEKYEIFSSRKAVMKLQNRILGLRPWGTQ